MTEFNPTNVHEAWPQIDTVMIGPYFENGKHGWFDSYKNLAKPSKISFFNQRNSSDVGDMYCNGDTKEHFPYPMHVYSFGITFQGPAMADWNTEERNSQIYGWSHNEQHSHLFTFELYKHASIRIRLEQDDKLLSPVCVAPPGYGTSGVSVTTNNIVHTSSLSTGGQGEQIMTNRWKFPVPLKIPRKSVFRVELEFSEYARDLLRRIGGPNHYQLISNETTELENVYFPSASMIQCSLIGKREVQQRGELHP